MDIIGFMDRVIVHSTCAVALIALLVLAQAFTRWNYLKNRVPVVVSSISLLLCCVGVAYLIRGHSITDAVFGVACFIWIAVCIATSYAFGEFWRQLYAFSCNENTKNWACAQVVDGLFMRLLSRPLGVARIRWGICRRGWCGCGGGCRSLRSRWRPRCRPGRGW